MSPIKEETGISYIFGLIEANMRVSMIFQASGIIGVLYMIQTYLTAGPPGQGHSRREEGKKSSTEMNCSM